MLQLMSLTISEYARLRAKRSLVLFSSCLSGSRGHVSIPAYYSNRCSPLLDILKFEYMTQLLLDSNYLPLILKMFAHQEIDQAVAQRTDRDELGYVIP